MALFYQPDLAKGVNQLPEDESRHAVQILRLKKGDTLSITDGKGLLMDGVILEPKINGCSFEIIKKTTVNAADYSIHLAVAPTKQRERMEWMVEKSIEIGVQQISFFSCKNSERITINKERLNRVAISAIKQSKKAWLPIIETDLNFQNMLTHKTEHRFIAFVDSSNTNHLKNLVKPKSTYTVLIGPEGDFTKDEIEEAVDSGFTIISLGQNRLRTETAGLAACHILNLVNQ